MAIELATCETCGTEGVPLTQKGTLRSHKNISKEKCPASGTRIVELPPEEPPCTNPDTANSATCSSTSGIGDPTPVNPSGTTKSSTTNTSQSMATLPGADEYASALAGAVEQVAFSPPAPVPFDQPARPPAEQPPLFDQPSRSGSRAARVLAETQPMTELGAQIAARLKEMFHGYSNRMERSQQATIGPSEIGTPCDRRIALKLLRYPTVNPGGDNWASFIGTCMHSGLEDMFLWADAGSGRYANEVRLTFPNKFVPKGTSDLLDRTLLCVMDHKGMGQWSLDKLKREGPSRTYRIQAHVYAYGQKLKGEKVKHVAIIGWPRDKSSLDDLYVWTEEYRPEVARDALKRVERIGDSAATGAAAYALPFDNSDCRFCPFHMKNAARSEGGVCNGRT